MRCYALPFAIALVVGCGSSSSSSRPPVQWPPYVNEPAPASTPSGPAPFAVADTHEPEVFAPPWTRVGVGQTISFSTAAIDQDLDETRVEVAQMPKTATFDAITQTVTWTPSKDDIPSARFVLKVSQPGRDRAFEKTFTIEVDKKQVAAPVAPPQRPSIETLLLIRDPARLADINREWPIDRILEVGAAGFALQFPPERRARLSKPLDGKTAYKQMLAGLAQTHANPRLDPSSPQFDTAAFGDPRTWKLVAFRPRIDKAWSELRIVYQAMNAHEPVFAMFRLRPIVEYVPALPRPDEERDADNKLFLALVAKHLMKNGGPDPRFVKDTAAHARAVNALMTELMTYDDTKTKQYLHGFMIGIALEARMGGGSARNADGSYKSGDGWGWSAQKPFQTSDGTTQAYVNVAIPGFWTKTVPSADKSTWEPACAPRWDAKDPHHAPGFDVLCRKTMGFVDLPDSVDGKLANGKREANNLYVEHKMRWMVDGFPLEDGRRDVGEENGMTCSQCHIRNFGMHDYHDPANVDPNAGVPKAKNHALPTLNFQIIPADRGTWEAFTLEFLDHQECRAIQMFERYVGKNAAKGLECRLAK